MKIAIFYLTDLRYLSMCVTCRSTTSRVVFHDPIVLGLACVLLHGGGPLLPSWAGRQSPLCAATWAFSWRPIHLWSLCFAEMYFTKALCHQLVLQELGGARGWKSMLMFPGTGGVSLVCFLFLITCLVKQGLSNPSLSLHRDPFNRPFTSTWWTISRVPSVPVGQVWDSSGSIFQNQM